jgi:hypothetical protein
MEAGLIRGQADPQGGLDYHRWCVQRFAQMEADLKES